MSSPPSIQRAPGIGVGGLGGTRRDLNWGMPGNSRSGGNATSALQENIPPLDGCLRGDECCLFVLPQPGLPELPGRGEAHLGGGFNHGSV